MTQPPKAQVPGRRGKKGKGKGKEQRNEEPPGDADEAFRRRQAKRAVGAVVTAEMKRKARDERKKIRAKARDDAEAARSDSKADILEVGPDGMAIEELSSMLAVSPAQIVGSLFMAHGVMTTINQTIDPGLVAKVCAEFEVDCLELTEEEQKEREESAAIMAQKEEGGRGGGGSPRAPIVCIMGHVDHGKTSLLDYVKKSTVAAGEAGGITQGVAAYRIPVGDQGAVVFLDTPGHEAFSAMRRRGARMTDIALLVVAADDGVRETTRQALKFARAAGVPVVVALTKADKPGANLDRVRQELADLDLLCEEWGGSTPTVAISSKTGENVDSLLETVLLVAELEDLRADAGGPARGTVIEAGLQRSMGCVATVMVESGTLRPGDSLRAGPAFGRVRSIVDDRGNALEEAGPSTPVQVSGLSSVPSAGDPVCACASLKEAESLAGSSPGAELMAGDVGWAGGADAATEGLVNLILRADSAGSLEAVRSSLAQIPQGKVVLKFISAGPGEISAGDVELAAATGSALVGFGVDVQPGAAARAKQAGVRVDSFDVIYSLLDSVRERMLELVEETEELRYLGSATVKQVFSSGRGGKVAGCVVKRGQIDAGCVVRVARRRDGAEGEEEVCARDLVTSIRRVKEEVSSIDEGNECGIGLREFSGFEPGDLITAYESVVVAPSL